MLPQSVLVCTLLSIAVASSAQDVRWRDLPQTRFERHAAQVAPEEIPSEVSPSPTPPLFAAERMARDTPPIVVHFANNRTIENARLVYDVQEHMMRATQEMAALLQQVAKERQRRTP